MVIELLKFGEDLHGRPEGKEAYDSIAPRFVEIAAEEDVFVDFKGIHSVSTSWLDEFLSALQKKFGEHLFLRNVTNLSAKLSLDTLEEIGGRKFKRE